jgi:hypothetical protein
MDGWYDEGEQATKMDLLENAPPVNISETGGTPSGDIWDNLQPGPPYDQSELRANVVNPEPGRHENKPNSPVPGHVDPLTQLFGNLF